MNQKGFDLINGIYWNILSFPDKSTVSHNQWKGFKKYTKKEFDTIVFTEDVTIRFLLHNSCKHHVDRKTNGIHTILEILKFIYEFYDEELSEENYELAFEDEDELREEAEEICEEFNRKLLNRDVFGTDPDPVFEGFEIVTNENSETIYSIVLGPT